MAASLKDAQGGMRARPGARTLVRLCFVVSLLLAAGLASSPSDVTAKAAPAYAGYDFSRPFRMDVFLRKRVAASVPYTRVRVMRLPQRPQLGFVRVPTTVMPDEGLYLVTKASWADELSLPRDPLVRRRLAVFTGCGDALAFSVPPGAAVLLPPDADATALVYSPPVAQTVCARARRGVQ